MSRFGNDKIGNLLHGDVKNGFSFLDDCAIESMDALFIKHQRARAFAAAILASREALPTLTNWSAADTTMR